MGKVKGGKRKRKQVIGSGDSESFKKFKAGDDEITESASVRAAVDRELDEVRQATLDAQKPKSSEDVKASAERKQDDQSGSDPYLLADATYIQKDTRWRNKQRTLVFCSRGVTSRFRHLFEDVRKLIPHHKTEPKFEKKASLSEINEICELKSCNNVIFFEARKMRDLYMWLGRVPSGPTMKFQVLNIHTTGEVRLAGNCLLGSRPVLHFDKHFGELAELKLMKTLLIQAFGTPRNHPKSKPFHDHIMSFHYVDRKIWFRHYQIAPETPMDHDEPEKQVLTEMGPRFVLDPVRFFSGSFSGQTIYANPNYSTPTALRVQARAILGKAAAKKEDKKLDKEERQKNEVGKPNPLDELEEVFE